MTTRISMNVSLTPKQKKLVKACVLSGRYQSDSEVVRQGLRLLEEYELTLKNLANKIELGFKQSETDQLIKPSSVLKKIKRLKSYKNG